MRPDDAVESVKCHAEYEESAAHCSDEEGWSGENTEPELVGRHWNIHGSVKISTETYRYKSDEIEPRIKTLNTGLLVTLEGVVLLIDSLF